MSPEILDNYSAAIKQSEKTDRFLKEKLYIYKFPKLKVVGSEITLKMVEGSGYSSTSNEDFINSMKFSTDRTTSIKEFLLEQIKLQAQEDLDNAKLEFKKIILERI